MVNKKILGKSFAFILIGVFGIASAIAYSPYTVMHVQNVGEDDYPMNDMHMPGQDIDSGREFSEHIREHNNMFSGTMNPGVHHRGYSGLN